MSKKSTTSAQPNASEAISAASDVHADQAGGAPASTSGDAGTHTPESEATATLTDGAGNPAGSAIRLTELSPEDIAGLLSGRPLAFVSDVDGNLRVATDIELAFGEVDAFVVPDDFENFEQLVAAGKFAKQIILGLGRAAAMDGPLKDVPIDNPAGVIEWMLGVIDDLGVALANEKAKASKPADADISDKRGFVLRGNVTLDHKPHEIGDVIWLTADQHAELRPTKTVHWDWEKGMED